MGLPQPFQFTRTNPQSLDESSTFQSEVAFQQYLSGVTAYGGQVVSVKQVDGSWKVYKINDDKTSEEIAVGSGSINGNGSIKEVVSISWQEYRDLETMNMISPTTQYNVIGDPADGALGSGGGSSGDTASIKVIQAYQWGSDFMTFKNSAMALELELTGDVTRPDRVSGYVIKCSGVLNSANTIIDAETSFDQAEAFVDILLEFLGVKEEFLDALCGLTLFCMENGSNGDYLIDMRSGTGDPEIDDHIRIVLGVLEFLMLSPELVFSVRYYQDGLNYVYEPLYHRATKGGFSSFIVEKNSLVVI